MVINKNYTVEFYKDTMYLFHDGKTIARCPILYCKTRKEEDQLVAILSAWYRLYEIKQHFIDMLDMLLDLATEIKPHH